MKKTLLAMIAGVLWTTAMAQAAPSVQTSGTLVIVPASGEVRHANDEAVLTLSVEEQDKDKAAAVFRVNQKMRQGVDIIKRQDPQALLQTRGYYTHPVYPETFQPRAAGARSQPVAWRVGQHLEVTTSSLAALPSTVAAAQNVLALNGLRFGLSPALAKKLDEERIAATYANMNERIASIAKAMGRNPVDAVLDTLDFEGSGNYQPQDAAPKSMRAAGVQEAQEVEEPSFEPGETTLQMRAVGKVRFR